MIPKKRAKVNGLKPRVSILLPPTVMTRNQTTNVPAEATMITGTKYDATLQRPQKANQVLSRACISRHHELVSKALGFRLRSLGLFYQLVNARECGPVRCLSHAHQEHSVLVENQRNESAQPINRGKQKKQTWLMELPIT